MFCFWRRKKMTSKEFVQLAQRHSLCIRGKIKLRWSDGCVLVVARGMFHNVPGLHRRLIKMTRDMGERFGRDVVRELPMLQVVTDDSLVFCITNDKRFEVEVRFYVLFLEEENDK
jgi:hypothetical protein